MEQLQEIAKSIEYSREVDDLKDGEGNIHGTNDMITGKSIIFCDCASSGFDLEQYR